MTLLSRVAPGLATLGLLVLAGCTALPGLRGVPASSGSARVVLTGWAARTAQSTAQDVSTVSISLTPLGGIPGASQSQDIGRSSVASDSAAASFSNLAAGNWLVRAEAFKADSTSLATATASATVAAGAVTNVTLPLKLAATNGLNLVIGVENGKRHWNVLDPSLKEDSAVDNQFADTIVGVYQTASNYDWWTYQLTNASGSYPATYSMTAQGLLEVAIAGQPSYVHHEPGGLDTDLNAMPGDASLVATGSVALTLNGTTATYPYRRYNFKIDYPYADGSQHDVEVDRWVAPSVGIFLENATEYQFNFSSSAPSEYFNASQSMSLTGFHLVNP